MKREKYVKTPDDWCPTWTDGTVGVFLHKDGKNNWRVAAWGMDDFGLELGHLSQEKALEIYRSIQDGVTVNDLKKLGFTGA